jgi:hypothetical protein
MPTAARTSVITHFPRPGDGSRIERLPDGRLRLSWDNRMAQDAAMRPVRVGRDQQNPNGGGPENASADPMGDLVKMLRGKFDREDHPQLVSLLRQISADPNSVPEIEGEDDQNGRLDDSTGSINPADFSSRYQPSVAQDAALRRRLAQDAVSGTARLSAAFADYNRLKHTL